MAISETEIKQNFKARSVVQFHVLDLTISILILYVFESDEFNKNTSYSSLQFKRIGEKIPFPTMVSQ